MDGSREDVLASFCEELVQLPSEGDIKGRKAKALHDVAGSLFGVESEAVWGWERDLQSERPEFSDPTVDVASVVPVSDTSDVAFVTTVLERTLLYSGFTALVAPVDLSLLYTSYSMNDSIRGFSQGGVDRIVSANLRHRDLVAQGRCAFVPASSTFQWGSASSDWRHRVKAPLLVQPSNSAYRPLNLRRPAAHLEDALWIYKEIVLPYFPQADLDLVAKVAENESESFRRFNSWLGRSLSRLSAATTTDEIEAVLEEIDEQIDLVSRDARRVSRLRSFRNIDLGVFVIGLGAAAAAPEGKDLLAGFLGTASFLDLIHNMVESRSARTELRQGTFFVPWLLQKGAGEMP
jgi:tetrahydromethanopterin S-methyltransferase subunit F